MKIVKLISTFFGIGYSPVAPGTAASIVAFILVWLFPCATVPYAMCVFFVMVIGFVVSSYAEDIFHTKDPGCVVIDEVAGVMLAVWGLYDTFFYALSALVLFRILDIMKPPFIRRVENLPRGWGIMLDDVIIGIYVNIVMHGVRIIL